MKSGYLAVAAAMAAGASAGSFHARHNHAAFHNVARGLNSTSSTPPSNATNGCGSCGEYTVWVTTYGEATLYQPPAPPATTTSTSTSTETSTSTIKAPETTSTPAPVVEVSTVVVVPTPFATTCPTPGIYTVPATTLTLTVSTTVAVPASTSVPAGTHTYGGVTTIVETATTVVCPYATVSTASGVVTSVIKTTTYVCPAAGTYTIAPLTTTVVGSTVLVYPTPASYAPGTYTQPEVVTTVTETNYVIYCPYASSSAAVTYAPAPTSAAKPTYKAAPAPYKAPSVASAAPAKSSSSSSSPSLGGSGNQWAMTYTPYNPSGSCKAAEDVLADLLKISSKGFTTVRMYSTDCNGLETVGAGARKAGLKIILGVFIDAGGCSGAQEQVTAITKWAQWELVELIVVGNEAIMGGHAGAGELAAFIKSSKSAFEGAGYSGPVTTTEPLNVLLEYSSELCDVIDVVGCNIHAFFNSDIAAAGAGIFVKMQLDIVDGLCPGKTGINLETGWPNAGLHNGAAIPGKDQQYAAIHSIMSEVGSRSVIFAYTDDSWKKDPGQFDQEQHWGAFDTCFN